MPGDGGLEDLFDYVRTTRGFDFAGYKRASLTRRLGKRMAAVNCEDYREYKELLEAQPDEFNELFNTILINVTSFFRDREAWDYIGAEVIPSIVASKEENEPIR